LELTTLGDDVVLKGAIASALTAGTGDRSRM
jgi:glucokinase